MRNAWRLVEYLQLTDAPKEPHRTSWTPHEESIELTELKKWLVGPKPILCGDVLQIGDHKYRLDDGEVNVLGAIAECGALNKTELLERSGQPKAVDIHKKLGVKHPQLSIRTPGRKGKGGYTANVTSKNL